MKKQIMLILMLGASLNVLASSEDKGEKEMSPPGGPSIKSEIRVLTLNIASDPKEKKVSVGVHLYKQKPLTMEEMQKLGNKGRQLAYDAEKKDMLQHSFNTNKVTIILPADLDEYQYFIVHSTRNLVWVESDPTPIKSGGIYTYDMEPANRKWKLVISKEENITTHTFSSADKDKDKDK